MVANDTPTDSGDTIDPGSGRILGAGANGLQQAIDALNRSVMANTAALSRLSGGQGSSSSGSGARATRTRTTTVSAPGSPSGGGGGTGTPGSGSGGAGGSGGRGIVAAGGGRGNNGGGDFFQYTKNTVNAFKNFGNAQLKLALPMDNYAQFAAIQQGSPLVPSDTSGGTVNSIRKDIFGSRNRNDIMWAQNVQDASRAAFAASRNSGYTVLTPGTRNMNPQFSNYLGNIKDLSILNPMMSATANANVLGTLTSTRGLYSAMMYGYSPVLGPGGQVNRNSLGAFTDSVMRAAFGKTTVSSQGLAASLGQNGILNGNISAYVSAAGGNSQTVQALEDYITGRNTAAQHGISGSEFDKLLRTYEAGGSAGKSAGNRLKKIGITNSILQSQKDVTAAQAQNTSDLLDSFGPAIKKANEGLANFYDFLNRIVNIPGWKQILGYGAGFGSVFGGGINTLLGGLGGFGLARVLGGAGSGGISSLVSGIGGGATTTLLSRAGSLARSPAAVGGAAAFLASQAGNQHWSKTDSELSAFKKWEQQTNNVSDIGKLKGKQFQADWNTFDKLWKSGRSTGNDGIGGGSSSTPGGGGSGGSSGQVITGKDAAGAIASAESEIGKPYAWGGTGPDSWDCSGLMQYAYSSIGVRLPRTSEQQMKVGSPVDRKDVRPGDLMFPYPGHVAMYVGAGKIIEAPRPGENVRLASVNEYGKYAAIRRIVGSVGNLSALNPTPGTAQKNMSDTFGGGDLGSQVIGSGSIEEVDAIQAALSSIATAVSSTPQNSSASNSDATSTPVSGPWKKDDSSVARAKALGKQLAAQLYHWTGGEWDALDKLWTGESNWRWWADNPTSHAYGIVQALPGSKMASMGEDWKTNPATQIKWGLKYIHDRYGDPMNAFSTWNNRSPHWYDTGAWNIPGDQLAMVHKGEMIIERPKADTIRNALMRDVVNTKDAASGTSTKQGGGGLTLVFDKGSVTFSVTGSMNESQAQAVATTFATTVANDTRLKALARGL